ncbi:hypothetical protein MGA3_03765 [Bacillus methanolicus MGA3]|uniref:Uncharacterized protein n=1 Tax=Bacillus methanolicus (strain MGA3 / ATCC 53907) TaxID=796606 RepID=I3E762_BACMM|nr:hypothetical protein BMMGA3_03625 [Bacillus methanolicus MGA3]EIJ82333.1 hypothetical protein MGA3_03765 [Bacillus methanolicus MGA3]
MTIRFYEQNLVPFFRFTVEIGLSTLERLRKLAERVRFHYYESFGKYSGRGCEKHIKFFTQHQGNINILWAIIETKEEQRRIKKELIDILQPKYETMKKEGLLY